MRRGSWEAALRRKMNSPAAWVFQMVEMNSLCDFPDWRFTFSLESVVDCHPLIMEPIDRVIHTLKAQKGQRIIVVAAPSAQKAFEEFVQLKGPGS